MTSASAVPLVVHLGADPPADPLADPLADPAEVGAALGGKGAWLARLLAAGFDVPSTSVVTTAAYRLTAAEPTLARLLAELEGRPPGDDLEAERERVDEAFLAVPLPDAVRRAIAEGAASARGPARSLLAVRSSATAEDMAATSFAGQYRSLLEIGDDGDCERAVRLVWASLWHPAPRAYRRAHGIAEHDLAMAAIVMAMVDARRAGVAFTVDPGGAPDVVRIEDVEGYAEGLVAGAVTPTVHLVARADPDREPDPLLAGVARLALDAEAAFGAPQDVEWAWDGSRTYLVQARPITAVADPGGDGWDTVADDDRVRTTAGIAEMLPGVLPPLVWDVAGFAVEEGFRSLLDRLGVLPPGLSGPFGVIGRTSGRAVMDLGLMAEVAGALPGGSADDVEAQYFGDASSTPSASPAAAAHPSGRGLRAARHDVRVLRARRAAVREAAVCEVATEALLGAVERDGAAGRLGTDRSDADLLAMHRRVLDLTVRTVAAEMAVAAAAVAAYRRLELLLLRHLDAAGAASWAQRLTTPSARPPRARSGWSGARVAALRSVLSRPDAAAVAAEESSWPAAAARLEALDGGDLLLAEVQVTIWRAGSRAVPGGPTWWEDPQPVWDLVRAGTADRRSAAPGRAGDAFAELSGELAGLPGWRRHRILTGSLVDARLTALRRAADDATALLSHREEVKADVLVLGGVLRSLHLEVGRRLVERGRLRTREDVDLLGLAELAPALAGRGPTPAELTRREHRVRSASAAGPLPARFRGLPEPVEAPLPTGDRLVGWGAGAGVATGRVRVMASPDDGVLEAGDVLVARSTDASWSPIFLRAAAIVVEEGGPLSHAAIVARELGIPAVLNLPGVVARCAGAGEVDVTVDGDHGLVVIGTPVGAAEVTS